MVGILGFETQLDLRRKDDREKSIQDALRLLRQVESEQMRPVVPQVGPDEERIAELMRQIELSAFIPTPGGVSIGGPTPLTPVQVRQQAEALLAGEKITPLSLAGGALELLDVPRQEVKRRVIEPVVPEFRVDVPTGVALAPLGPLADPLRVGLAGLEAAGVPVPKTVPITSGLVEEAASWVLDPLNLVFFVGPTLKGLRAAGGATKLAQRIRTSGKVPAFVRAAMKRSAAEAGGTRLGGKAVPGVLRESSVGQGEVEEAVRLLETGPLPSEVAEPRLFTRPRPEGRTFRAEPPVRETEFPLPGAEQMEVRATLQAVAPKLEARATIRNEISRLEGLLAAGGKRVAGAGRQEPIRRRIQGLRQLLDDDAARIAGGLEEAGEPAARGVPPGPPEPPLGGFGGRGGRTGGPRFPEGGPPIEEPPSAKLTELIKQAKPARGGQGLLLHEERARKIAAADKILRGTGTPEEKFFKAKSALGGETPKIQFEPVRPEFTDDEIQSLVNAAEIFDFGAGQRFENIRATDSLLSLLAGELPVESDLVLLERVFGPELARAVLGKERTSRKLYRAAIELTSLPKTVLTILDHSFPGRQGIKLAPSRPIEWTKSAVAGTRALLNPKVAFEVDRALLTDATPILIRDGAVTRNIPFGALKKQAGLYHAPLGEAAPLVARQDEFMSRWARRIPGLGNLVFRSEAAFTTSGNKIRSDTLKRILLASTRNGEPVDLANVHALANLLTRATGRGTLGAAESLAPALNALQLAPRFRVSHPQWALNLLNFGNRKAQKEAAREIVSFFTAGTTLLGILELSDAPVRIGMDPKSSDWGKIVIGKQRVDIWGGVQPVMRAIAQMTTGERTTSTGERVPVSRQDVAFRYFRAGMSPFASFLTDVITGETITGEELGPTRGTVQSQLFNRAVPLAWQDIVDAIREEGATGGVFGALALTGVGVQTYETFAQERARRFKEETGLDFDVRNGGHWALLRQNKDLKDFAKAKGEAKETQDFLNEKIEELRLPSMARALEQGAPVGPQFREAWEDFEAVRANAAARLAFGKDRDPADDAAFAAWQAIDREQFRDPVTFQIDYGAYRAVKDSVFAQLDPIIQEAMGIVGADDPLVSEWATSYVSARLVRRQLYGISKWQGLTPAQSQMLDSFSREVRALAPTIAAQQGQRVSEEDVARFLAEQRGQPGLADWFGVLQSSKERDRRRNPEYDEFLEGNRGIMQPFYPELYSQATLERIGVIEEESRGLQPLEELGGLQPVGLGQ